MPKGIKNLYRCQSCEGVIITLDVDEGVTPFMLPCLATEGCEGLMTSSFYGCPQDLPAQFEFFKPESLKGYSREMRDHIHKGGLDIRKVKKVEQCQEKKD